MRSGLQICTVRIWTVSLIKEKETVVERALKFCGAVQSAKIGDPFVKRVAIGFRSIRPVILVQS